MIPGADRRQVPHRFSTRRVLAVRLKPRNETDELAARATTLEHCTATARWLQGDDFGPPGQEPRASGWSSVAKSSEEAPPTQSLLFAVLRQVGAKLI